MATDRDAGPDTDDLVTEEEAFLARQAKFPDVVLDRETLIPEFGILDGKRVRITAAWLAKLTPAQKTELAVNFGDGYVRPFRFSIESDMLNEAEEARAAKG